MTDTDWPLWGDAGDLFAADPTGHVRRTIRAVIRTIWTACGVPELDPADIDKILEPLL